MFEQLPATAIQDRLSDAIYKWISIGNWPEAEATDSGGGICCSSKSPTNLNVSDQRERI